MRRTASSRTAQAGCFVCNNGLARWFGANAVGVAARHHDATGHPTWADQVISTRYGAVPAADSRQADIEDFTGAAAPQPGAEA